MELSEKAEEILEALWVNMEEEGKKPLDLGASRDEPAISELEKLGFIKLDANHIYLLEKGKQDAQTAIRRHRLAERLLADVLDVKKKIINEVSCRFEHLLHKGLEDNLCILLGHPKICPHGKPIPPGKCCREKGKKEYFKVVSSLSELKEREKGVVAYLHTKDPARMQKLMAIGALPGMNITLLQRFPSYVFKIGESQFAVDKALAEGIYVRLTRA